MIFRRDAKRPKKVPVGNSRKDLARARKRFDPDVGRRLGQKSVFALLLGIGIMVFWLWWPTLVKGFEYWLEVREQFLIKEIVVEGNVWTRRRSIVAALRFAPRQLIFGFDIEAARRRVAALPFIREAWLRRRWPDRIEIRVREYRPVALLNLDRLYLVGDEGRVLAPVTAGEPLDYPLISGFTLTQWRSRPWIWRRLLQRAVALLKVWKMSGQDWPEGVDQIVLDEVSGITVLTTRPAWELQLGWCGYRERLLHWRRVLEVLGDRSRQVRYFDCVAANMVVAGLRH